MAAPSPPDAIHGMLSVRNDDDGLCLSLASWLPVVSYLQHPSGGRWGLQLTQQAGDFSSSRRTFVACDLFIVG